MGILTVIKSLFGKGKLKFSIKLADGREGTAKLDYVGDISTLDLEKCKRKIEFEASSRVVEIELIDHLVE